MASTVFVISDLHLGGSDTFQMCSAAGRARLAEFLSWVTAQRSGERNVRLVLAGDVVDFLAEEDGAGEWSAFTADEERAVGKLDRIIGSTEAVWSALRVFVESGSPLTILLGNHDIELALPAVRRRLLEAVAPRGGQIEVLHDGEAFRCGRLLVEHGNRYDPWNAVAHDELRRVRARLSRGERAGTFTVQPGSRLVVDVMNPIKRKFSFIDLLKPETSGAIPILAVLDPSAWRRASGAIRSAVQAAWRSARFDAHGMPPEDLIAVAPATTSAEPAPLPDEDAFALADELANASAGTDMGDRVGVLRDVQLKLLLRAFRKRFEKDCSSFRVEFESELYLKPARHLAANRFDAVVFGHSHHAKRIALDGSAIYLNSGTWADLMRIPETVYTGSEADGVRALENFIADLRENRIDALRRQVATFVRVEQDDNGRVTDARTWFFDGADRVEPITTAGVLKRLGFS